MRALYALGFALLVGWLPLSAMAKGGYSEQGSELCVSCHGVGENSVYHSIKNSPHGKGEKSPMKNKGCEHCHGPSAAHAQAPTKTKPGMSFGPRWSDSVEGQNQSCLQCHNKKLAQHWPQGVHGQNQLSCVTCHDIHSQDNVLNSAQQSQVCTQCHKVQKAGIHHHQKSLEKNPPCSTCHQPHGDAKAIVTLLENRSQGCASCHDLKAMQQSTMVSEKAKTYHKAMAQLDRTCIDCHQSVAHVPLDQIPAPVTDGSNVITLFAPGKANLNWILSDHPGAQPFRQGRNCTQCHQGEEAELGKSMSEQGASSVSAKLDIKVEGKELVFSLGWKGNQAGGSVALMFDDGSDEQFTRAGCWAACHNDLPGQERNRGQAITKYLNASLKQQRSVGRFAVSHDEATLKSMMEQGHYVEMWRAQLKDGKLEKASSYQILSARSADQKPVMSASAQYQNGQWKVQFRKPLTGPGKAVSAGKLYTFGIAIHGANGEKSAHWVSLPRTFGLNNGDADYKVKMP